MKSNKSIKLQKRITVTFLFLTIIINSYAQIPQDNLLLYYPFNGNALDESGNNFDGIVHGATLTDDRFGNPNSAYSFDGVNDYIEMPNDILLKPSLPISISFWVKPQTLKQLDNVFFSTSPDPNNHAGCEINTTSDDMGKININLGDNSGVNSPESRRTKTTEVNLSTGIWFHVVGVFRGLTDMDIYINASKIDGTYSGSGGKLNYTENPGCIGRLHEYLYFWGALDDFSYYHKALDSSEVADLFTQRNCHDIIYDTITVTDTLVVIDSIAVTDTLIINIPNPGNTNNEIKVYPNPTTSAIYVHIGGFDNLKDYSIRIIDNLGETIFNNLCNKEEFQINLDTFGPSGVYYIQIYNPQYQIIATKKIILQ